MMCRQCLGLGLARSLSGSLETCSRCCGSKIEPEDGWPMARMAELESRIARLEGLLRATPVEKSDGYHSEM